MGQHSIIEKLHNELKLPLKRESQVLYLMAEIRKYLEHEKENGTNDFPELEFFCNWALHTKIDRRNNAPNIRAFLKPFDMTPGMSLEDYLSSGFHQTILQPPHQPLDLHYNKRKHSKLKQFLKQTQRQFKERKQQTLQSR